MFSYMSESTGKKTTTKFTVWVKLGWKKIKSADACCIYEAENMNTTRLAQMG
jgi:hypothetical protein